MTSPIPSIPADAASARIVADMEASARKELTPCGDGSMVWRVWGKGEPLVLLHGGSGSWRHWIRNIPALGQHFELWVPDIPGLGDSAMPEPRTPAGITEIMCRGLDALFPSTTKIHLAGFSFGGQVAGLMAALTGARFRDLTLIGVAGLGLRADPRAPFAKVRTGMSADEVAGVWRQNLEVLMFADPAKIDTLAIHLQAENIARARFRSRPFAATDGLAQALGRTAVPLKTIWGTRDIIARPSLEARLDILRRHHPELEVRLIDGAGHWVAYEAADAFNQALLELLGKSRAN